jgi:hypothetical protein
MTFLRIIFASVTLSATAQTTRGLGCHLGPAARLPIIAAQIAIVEA